MGTVTTGAFPKSIGGASMAKPFKPGGRKGKLHEEMGIPKGQKIPQAKLKAATRSPDKAKRRDAIRAETMEGWNHSHAFHR